jgi:hypothetical protein
MIARRLRALGHAPDYLAPGAVDCLMLHAGGSVEQLRMGLAAVLFLAATEDAPLVDEKLAARALHTNGAAPAGPSPVGFAPTNWVLPTLFGVLVTGLMLALAIVATRKPPVASPVPAIVVAPAPIHTPPVSTVPVVTVPTVTLPTAQAPASTVIEEAPLTIPPVTMSVPLQPPPKIAVTAPPARGLKPMPPPVTIRQPPVPATARRLELRVPAASPSVMLVFPAHSLRALARLQGLAVALERAGFNDIRARPSSLPPPYNVVAFFHDNDAALAQRVAATLASIHWPHLDRTSLQPSLVPSPSRGDGEIEVRLP